MEGKLIKLSNYSRRVSYYRPPFEITRHFDDVDTDADPNTQIEQLLWIPAVLVGRFVGQWPCLESEADELFSIGVQTVVETVHRGAFSGEKIGAIVNVNCRYAMESYANNLGSALNISTTTRYVKRKEGKKCPRGFSLGAATKNLTESDSMVELEVKDACEMLGYNRSNLSTKQKRRLWEVLK